MSEKSSSKKQKVSQTQDSVVGDLIPSNYTRGSFEECIYGFDRAQSEGSDLWLFKLPPELTAEDISNANIEIPPHSLVKHQDDAQKALSEGSDQAQSLLKSIDKGYHKIASFTHKNIKYQLFETPSSEAESIVNLWTDDDSRKSGSLVRGKPFTRYFIVLVDTLSTAAQYASGPIPFMPMGFNQPFVPKKVTMPRGLTNPYETNSDNIVKMHKEDNFLFTSGDMAATAAADIAYLNPNAPKRAFTDSVKTEEKNIKKEIKKEKKDKKDKKEKKDKN